MTILFQILIVWFVISFGGSILFALFLHIAANRKNFRASGSTEGRAPRVGTMRLGLLAKAARYQGSGLKQLSRNQARPSRPIPPGTYRAILEKLNKRMR